MYVPKWYLHGLINAGNIALAQNPTYNVPGWDKPVPEVYFGK